MKTKHEDAHENENKMKIMRRVKHSIKNENTE